MNERLKYIWITLRLGMAWLFIWPFIDKVFGLGFATEAKSAWLAGGSPTFGFLKFVTKGPFSGLFKALSGNVFVDWLFMLGLAFIGLSLLIGIFVKIASYSGVVMVFLMWLSNLPPVHNPFLDEHIIYIIVLLGLAWVNAGQWFGLGKLDKLKIPSILK